MHNADNDAVRTKRRRYIRYADGSEELYDMVADCKKWNNPANEARYYAVNCELAKSLPRTGAAPAPGSAQRTPVRDGQHWCWEGEVIRPEELRK